MVDAGVHEGETRPYEKADDIGEKLWGMGSGRKASRQLGGDGLMRWMYKSENPTDLNDSEGCGSEQEVDSNAEVSQSSVLDKQPSMALNTEVSQSSGLDNQP